MKLLYFTTACNRQKYEYEISRSRVKPSIASCNFESALIDGLKADKSVDMTLVSFPMLSAFPNSSRLYWGSESHELDCGLKTTLCPTVNLIGIKQFSQHITSMKIIKRWLLENKNISDKAILIYSVYLPIASNIIKLCKQNNCKCFVIIPDIPKHMYSNKRISGIKSYFAGKYVAEAIKIQDKFDGYIYFTEAMRNIINPNAPYCIVEGIADINAEVNENIKKENPPAVMYAGALSKKYGIDLIIEAFKELGDNYQLWICGTGDYEAEVKKASKSNKNIVFWGRLQREEVIRLEKKASILLNLRNPKDEYTAYSFPSKTLEYMMSGTPVLTTRLPGIPEEYFNYLYVIDELEPDEIATKIKFALQDKESKLGSKARKFVIDRKNQKVQAAALIDLINKVI